MKIEHKTEILDKSVLKRQQKIVLELCESFLRKEKCNMDIDELVIDEMIKQDMVELLASEMFIGVDSSYETIAKIKCQKNKSYYDFIYNELKPIFVELNNLDYALTKGLLIALYGYSNVEYRGTSDVDILVDKNDVAKVSKILKKFGFRQGFIDEDGVFVEYQREQVLFFLTQTHQMAPYFKRTGNRIYPYVCVDVNFDLLWGETNFKVNVKDFLLNPHFKLFNDVRIKCLDLEKCVLHLCLHNYKENNSLYLLCNENCFKLRRYFDTMMLLMNDEFDMMRFVNLVEKYDICEYVYYSLYYAHFIFNYKMNSAFDNWCDKKLLQRYGLQDTEYKSWDSSFLERVFDKAYIDALKNNFTDVEKAKIFANEEFMKRAAKK